MSVIAVGLSHHTAPVGVLECVALSADAQSALLKDLLTGEHIMEAVVLSTCNRLEVYVEAERFHGGVADVSDRLARHTAVSLEALTPHLYVHFEERAVEHLFTVGAGLDSMVVGEGQILGQVKRALALAQEHGAAGRVLNELLRQALTVAKRAHTETDIDRAGRSLVTVGLAQAHHVVGGVEGRRAVVVGAGSMSALAATTLRRLGAGEVVVANRTLENATRLADSVGGRAVALADLTQVMTEADIVVSCTGSSGLVVSAPAVAEVSRTREGRPLFVLDLALPRDVDPEVRELPGVSLVDLERLGAILENVGDSVAGDVDAVRRLVAEQVLAFTAWRRAVSVAPTVVALRSMAAEVVEAELVRLEGRLPHLVPDARDEIAQAVRRVVDKLLHAPTVRVKELAGEPGGHRYAEALRALFDLDLQTVDAVSRVTGAQDEGER